MVILKLVKNNSEVLELIIVKVNMADWSLRIILHQTHKFHSKLISWSIANFVWVFCCLTWLLLFLSFFFNSFIYRLFYLIHFFLSQWLIYLIIFLVIVWLKFQSLPNILLSIFFSFPLLCLICFFYSVYKRDLFFLFNLIEWGNKEVPYDRLGIKYVHLKYS